MNFLQRLALQEKKIDDSSRLDVVEIAHVPDMLSELVSFLVGLRTYQHPGKYQPDVPLNFQTQKQSREYFSVSV